MSAHVFPHLRPSNSCYTRGCRCDGCRAEHADYSWESNQARKARPDLYPVPHGTKNGYDNYICRCDACRHAGVEYHRQLRQRRRGTSA